MKTIGVLGGMGPEASASFYQMIINISHNKYKAVQDTDYPPMIIYSLPLIGFDETGIVNEKQVLDQLIIGVKKLEKAESNFIIITCNTVHCFIKELRKNVKIPILSIIEEISKKLKEDHINKVGLLASDTTINLKIYDKILNKIGIETVIPNKLYQKIITKIILNVMSGKVSLKDKKDLIKIIDNLKKDGIEAVILGCTELPLVLTQNDSNLRIYDTLMILAENSLKKARDIKR